VTELDLQSDDPEEYEGRVVRLDGAEYEIGPYLGEGGERFVHELVNRRFGRSTHVILILRDQENAACISAQLRENLEKLRSFGLSVVHDHITVRAHGGVFELREGLHLTEVESEMGSAVNAGRDNEAAALAEHILATETDNFVALNVLAFVAGKRGDPLAGLRLALAALRIEPNTKASKVVAMRCALTAGAFETFWWQFEDLVTKWPNEHSADELAATAYLTVGTPEKATGLRLDGELAEHVQQAVRAKEEADEVMRASFALQDTPDQNGRNRDILETAYRLYDRSPYIAVNYGLALMRCDQGRAAHDVLAKIVPVLATRLRAEVIGYMAFGLAIDHDWAGAYRLLDCLTTLLDDEAIKPADLPGWPLWWFERDQMMLYAKTHKPFRLIARVIAHTRADQVRPAVRAMALLYERHPTNPD
jgi:hypothetical protein